jgi:hypothetical protein
MAFEKGQGGRPPGSTNLLTRTVKETVLSVFNELQTDPKHNLKAFAKSNPKDFYIIAAKLIPTDIAADVTIKDFNVTLKVYNPNGS